MKFSGDSFFGWPFALGLVVCWLIDHLFFAMA